MGQAFRELGRIMRALSNIVGKWLRIAFAISIAWPVMIIACAMIPYHYSIIFTPLVTLMPIFVVVTSMFIFLDPLTWTVIGGALMTPTGRKALQLPVSLIGIELLIGIYFSVVPISRDRQLVPLLTLVAIALCFFAKGKVRWTLVGLLTILTLIFFLGGRDAIRNRVEAKTVNISTTSIHPNFVPRRICDVVKVQSYANKDLSKFHDTIKITLVEGCYADWYLIPGSWDEYETQLSHNEGDYVSMWCNNNPNPYPILEYDIDAQGILRRESHGCYAPGQITNEFHFQGHGTLTLIATSKRISKPIKEDGYPAL